MKLCLHTSAKFVGIQYYDWVSIDAARVTR